LTELSKDQRALTTSALGTNLSIERDPMTTARTRSQDFWHIWGPQNTSGRENSTCYFTEWCTKSKQGHVHMKWKWCIKSTFKVTI